MANDGFDLTRGEKTGQRFCHFRNRRIALTRLIPSMVASFLRAAKIRNVASFALRVPVPMSTADIIVRAVVQISIALGLQPLAHIQQPHANEADGCRHREPEPQMPDAKRATTCHRQRERIARDGRCSVT
jgi:hypothetical protein